MIMLTEQQRQTVINGDPVQIASPEIGEDLVVVKASRYQQMQESLEDQREQKAVLRYSMKQASRAAQENPF